MSARLFDRQGVLLRASLILLSTVIAVHVVGLLRLNLTHLAALRVIMPLDEPTREADRASGALETGGQLQILHVGQADRWLWSAEVYAAGHLWSEAGQAYQAFLADGGNATHATNRLRALATYQRWCPHYSNHLLSLAEILSGEGAAYRLLGDACTIMGDDDAAVDAYRRAFQLTHTQQAATSLAWLLFQRGQKLKATQPERSDADFREVISIFEAVPPVPGDTASYYALAWSSWQQNLFDAAISEYQACLSTAQPPDRYAYSCALNLGHSYSDWLPESRRDLEKALYYYTVAQKFAFDTASQDEAKESLGRVQLRLGHP
ncbi:MAG: hypothetical protein M1570_05825 [Chloroflexi bacterium]|nr:hypothetical protein [Chloroflexota bacterium]